MVVDIYHLFDTSIYDVFKHCKNLVVATYSNARAVKSDPRNIADDMIRKLADKGGVMGID